MKYYIMPNAKLLLKTFLKNDIFPIIWFHHDIFLIIARITRLLIYILQRFRLIARAYFEIWLYQLWRNVWCFHFATEIFPHAWYYAVNYRSGCSYLPANMLTIRGYTPIAHKMAHWHVIDIRLLSILLYEQNLLVPRRENYGRACRCCALMKIQITAGPFFIDKWE